jgi:ribosomal protein S18 acetylase RimI-like enzyme
MQQPAPHAACAIRPAQRHESPDVSNVITSALEALRGAAPNHVLDLYIEHSRAIEQQWEGGEVIVLENRDCIVGTVVYYGSAHDLNPRWASVRTLMVHPDACGQGFGRKLMEHCIGRARRDGADQIGLHTAAFMKRAVALYERLGFVRCPARDLRASDLLDFDPLRGDVSVVAYRCDVR